MSSSMLDVLRFLPIPLELLQSLDYQAWPRTAPPTPSLAVTHREFHRHYEALRVLGVSLAMSSPIFFGERPSGPIFGAGELAAPTSPPVTRTYTINGYLPENCSVTDQQCTLRGLALPQAYALAPLLIEPIKYSSDHDKLKKKKKKTREIEWIGVDID
ncbi:hypothetical protein Syun_010634 [Stephania yunnanensis]|uniref:Uncharacterized protein n=1 Tax=Stephania yunnanensis TaxID=152371 RepID=A0AAP0KJH1_9MAGN